MARLICMLTLRVDFFMLLRVDFFILLIVNNSTQN